MTSAVYPLSADPIHNGHLYNLGVAVKSGLFYKVHLMIGHNSKKKYTFNENERVYLARKVISSSGLPEDKIVVNSFSGLLRNYAVLNGIDFIIRGYRNGLDSDYEAMLASFNSEYNLKTFVVPADGEFRNISSSMVRDVSGSSGLVHKFVHPAVKQALEERLRGFSLIGVTGGSGVGKTSFCQGFVKYVNTHGINAYHIDYDKLIRNLLDYPNELGRRARKEIAKAFGEEVFYNENKYREKLGSVVFGDLKKRKQLAEILRVPAIVCLEENLKELKGFVLVDAAYFTEYNMLPLVNYNMVLVNCNPQESMQRLLKRDNGIKKEMLLSRINSQQPYDEKKRIIQNSQKEVYHGFFHEVDTTKGICEQDFKNLIQKLNENFPLFGEKNV